MLRYASAHNDIELEGYVHHSIAYVEHFILGRYEKFLEHLRLATQCLMRSEDKSEMMHVYYLVAIDAMNMSVVVGTLAGDDTLLIIMRDVQAAIGFCIEIKKLLD